MLKQPFHRRKNALAILVVFLVIISMTAVAVNAAPHHDGHHKGGHHGGHHSKHGGHGGHHHGGYNQGGHHFHNLHDHRHHGQHDHYYGDVYYGDYEWVYNPYALVSDRTYMPGVVAEQPYYKVKINQSLNNPLK